MTVGEIIAVIIVALFVGSIFYYGFKRTGPWGSLWSFLLVLFLGTLLVSVWLDPVGPIWWGAAWIDLLFFGLIFALLLAAATPPSRQEGTYTSDVVTNERDGKHAAVVAIGLYFWLMLVLLTAAIIAGLML